MRRSDPFWVPLSILLAMVSAVRPGGIGADYEAYTQIYSADFMASIEPVWWIVNKIFSLVMPFPLFLFLLVFFLLVWIGRELDWLSRGHKYIFVLIYFPVFFLGQIRSGCVAILILNYVLVESRRATSSKWQLICMPTIHFASIFASLYLYILSRFGILAIFKLLGLLFFFGALLLLVSNVIDLEYGNVIISFLSEDLDKWRIVQAALEGPVDEETRSLFFNSPRFFLYSMGILIIFLTRRKWIKWRWANSVWGLLFSCSVYIAFSSVAMVAQKTSYIANPLAILIFLGQHRSTPLRLFAGSVLLYDFFSLTVTRLTE
jgi:hypothetical protein